MFLKRRLKSEIENLIRKKTDTQAILYTLSLKEKLNCHDVSFRIALEGRITKIDAQLEVLNTLVEAL